MDCSLPGSSVHGFPRQEYWSGVPLPSPNTHNSSPKMLLPFISTYCGFPGGTGGKEPAFQCRRHKRMGSIPGPGRSPGGGHANPLQYSLLKNPMDRVAWQATVHRVAKSRTWLKWFSTHTWIPDTCFNSNKKQNSTPRYIWQWAQWCWFSEWGVLSTSHQAALVSSSNES